MKTIATFACAFALTLAASMPMSLAQDGAVPAATALADLLAVGEPLYLANCKSCHGAGGGGFVGPSFLGNDRIANAEFVIRQITKGGADMPPFGKKLTPEEILAVGSYIRNSWGNTYGILAP